VLALDAEGVGAAVATGGTPETAPPEPDDGPFWAGARLSLRLTAQAAIPSPALLFDPGTSLFAAGRYLAPGPSETSVSGLLGVSAGVEATGWLAFRLDADSGLLRVQRLPSTATLCFSTVTLSGLAVAPACGNQGPAASRVLLPVPSTSSGPRELTSNGLPAADELAETLLLRQLYADLSLGAAGFLHARIGRQRLRVADGLVYDDWGLGVDLDADLGAIGPPLAAGLSAFYPTRGWPSAAQWSSPVLAATLDWLPSLGEWLGVWGAFAHDDGGSAAQILRQGLVEDDVVQMTAYPPGSREYVAASRRAAVLLAAAPRGTSDLGWAGVAGRLEVGEAGEARLACGAAFGHIGTFAIEGSAAAPSVTAVDVPVLGWAASLRWTSHLGRGVQLSPFLVYLSGDDPANDRRVAGAQPTYRGFLAVSPFLTATNLFFSGGISEAYADRTATSSGVNARGVIAPGLEVGWSPASSLDLRWKAAWLWADQMGPFGGRDYGPEVDLDVAWTPLRWLTVLGEADVLVLGSFFPERGVARRFILGVDVRFP
jgi:hypothetical protein